MRNFKYVLGALFLSIVIISCSEKTADKLTNCAIVAALSKDYKKAGKLYLKEPTKENCTAYREIADKYITALKGCSTIAKATLNSVEDIRAALDCSKKEEEQEETTE